MSALEPAASAAIRQSILDVEAAYVAAIRIAHEHKANISIQSVAELIVKNAWKQPTQLGAWGGITDGKPPES